ncbi:FxsA cytoplasmic membrane protein [Kribbella flavida DSM 17836]|uniref:FxsA cytoplasmic membrane protein n=1 Tax=Kribbella flavida (strain DSM 17836 / JCM 10339 / NBRC 14399) TaxID=479435 RepID=D2PMV3_KRIFD|nr:FxsA family protein [Kribbella flavida]ADB32655.1 FxsA cytoplasmic membrane protein [Kribbella flavida DSM 17836]
MSKVSGSPARKTRGLPWFVAVALLVVPIVEIYVLIQVGQVIGGWPTVALLLVESALGAWLIKREGRRAWNALRGATETGRMPGKELADAALLLVGGTLLLTPGFVTDVVGFFFVLPFTRPLARRALSAFLGRRIVAQLGGNPITGFMPGTYRPPTPDQAEAQRRRNDDVVQGEVIDPDTPPRPTP